jgi:hypothetical protein
MLCDTKKGHVVRVTKKLQAKPINDQSWILMEWGNRRGLLSTDGDSFSLLMQGGVSKFASIDQVEAHVGGEIVFDKPADVLAESTKTLMVAHLPVKHDAVFNTEMQPVISYTKQARSDVRFAAGYWGFLFSNGWTGSFCPKLATLAEYEHVGPFASKLEMNTILSQRNAALNKEQGTKR